MNYEINMDATDYTIVAACPCGWRHFTFIRSEAWHRAAEHLKTVHGALYAARRAADAEAASRRREAKQAVTSPNRKRPNTKRHGTSGHARAAGQRAATDSGAQQLPTAERARVAVGYVAQPPR